MAECEQKLYDLYLLKSEIICEETAVEWYKKRIALAEEQLNSELGSVPKFAKRLERKISLCRKNVKLLEECLAQYYAEMKLA